MSGVFNNLVRICRNWQSLRGWRSSTDKTLFTLLPDDIVMHIDFELQALLVREFQSEVSRLSIEMTKGISMKRRHYMLSMMAAIAHTYPSLFKTMYRSNKLFIIVLGCKVNELYCLRKDCTCKMCRKIVARTRDERSWLKFMV